MIILKILLIIFLSLIILLTILLFLHIHIKAFFAQELVLEVRMLFIKFRVLPQKEKKKKKGSPKKDSKKKPEKKQSVLKEKGLPGFLTMLKELVTLSSPHVLYLLSKTKVKKLEIYLSYAGDDAAKTAIGYGKCCAVVYPAAAFLAERTNCKSYSVEVVPDFEENAKTEISAILISHVRVIRIVITALKFLAGYIELKTKGVV